MVTPLYVRYMYLEIALQSGSAETFQFECSATSIGLVASGGDLTSLSTLCPAGSFAESSPRTWSLDVTAVQDVESNESFMLFLMDHEGELADVTWYPKTDANKVPQGRGWTGVVTLGVPNQVGGVEPGNYATFTVSLPFQGKPSPIDSEGNSIQTLTGVTAGTPGSFQPDGVQPPADLPTLQADPNVGTAAMTGQAAWTTGQYVDLGDASQAHWDGATWSSGAANALTRQDALVGAGSGYEEPEN